jgi:dihydrofolate reductase
MEAEGKPFGFWSSICTRLKFMATWGIGYCSATSESFREAEKLILIRLRGMRFSRKRANLAGKMRKIRIMEHISLDGVIQPDGDGDFANGGWMARYRTPAGAAAVAEAQGASFDLLLGRRTYDLWAYFWPKVGGGPFADGLNAATKYVATHRPENLAWGPVGDLGADIIDGVRRVKATDGPDLIVWGSSTLTTALLGHGLVDEVVLIVYPVLLGRGKRFVSDSVDPRELVFVSTKVTPTGVLINTYRHVGSLRTK